MQANLPVLASISSTYTMLSRLPWFCLCTRYMHPCCRYHAIQTYIIFSPQAATNWHDICKIGLQQILQSGNTMRKLASLSSLQVWHLLVQLAGSIFQDRCVTATCSVCIHLDVQAIFLLLRDELIEIVNTDKSLCYVVCWVAGQGLSCYLQPGRPSRAQTSHLVRLQTRRRMRLCQQGRALRANV